jgi:acyl dehydratase
MSGERIYFDDFRPGMVFDLGSRTVTEEEIIRFGRKFDPQPFHIDAEAAKNYPYGGLIASGWHTAAMVMRMFVDNLLNTRAPSLASPGIDELRWLKPIRPGDTISVTMMVEETRASASKPDRGLVFVRHEVTNQRGETAMTMRSKGFYPRKPGAAA